MKRTIRIGSRGSRLSLWQTRFVTRQISAMFPKLDIEVQTVRTTGDRNQTTSPSEIGVKGIFTRELDKALFEQRIDVAVHSLKDVPTILDERLALAAVATRGDVRDAFISKNGMTIANLPPGETVATGSLRRQAQLLNLRPDLNVVPIRGNVDTRLRKLRDSNEIEAVILALVGLQRLEMQNEVTEILEIENWLPAAGQGAIGVICQKDNVEILSLLGNIDKQQIHAAVNAERAVLRQLNLGCHVPVGVYALPEENRLVLNAFVAVEDGSRIIRARQSGSFDKAEQIGTTIADELLRTGARDIVDRYLQPKEGGP